MVNVAAGNVVRQGNLTYVPANGCCPSPACRCSPPPRSFDDGAGTLRRGDKAPAEALVDAATAPRDTSMLWAGDCRSLLERRWLIEDRPF